MDKFKRDRSDYQQGTVYLWPHGHNYNQKGRRRAVSFSLPSSTSASEDDEPVPSASEQHFLEERKTHPGPRRKKRDEADHGGHGTNYPLRSRQSQQSATRKRKASHPNISLGEQRALQWLASNPDIVIKPADKGGATDQHYRQVKGTAMGAAYAPNYAGLFMGLWEEEHIFHPSNPHKDNIKWYGRLAEHKYAIRTENIDYPMAKHYKDKGHTKDLIAMVIEAIPLDARGVLCRERPGFTRALNIHIVQEGDDFRLQCLFYKAEEWILFCKNGCDEKEDVLVRTHDLREANGRYRIEVEQLEMFVIIRNVTVSDSGIYSCGFETWNLRRQTSVYTLSVFIVDVANALSSSPSPEVFTSDSPRTSAPDQDLASQSDVWLYAGLTLSALLILSLIIIILIWRKRHRTATAAHSPSPSPDAFTSESPRTSEPEQDLASQSGVALYIGLALSVLLILLLTFALLLWRKRSSKTTEPPETPVYAQIPESSRVYEEIQADGQSRAAPAQMSSVSFSNTTQSCDIYSLCSAPNGSQAADSSDTFTYSEVDFSKHSSAPRCPTARSEATPLYSTVALTHK
ncbi:hypothetical protein WMY93_014812 [Mugilogobius chulae]|uniref:Ig-like domain-containing protein n=1 Tax=Mugilogobius chulae TaxID=88201 RepID=A0AAW0P6C1_9GOBI